MISPKGYSEDYTEKYPGNDVEAIDQLEGHQIGNVDQEGHQPYGEGDDGGETARKVPPGGVHHDVHVLVEGDGSQAPAKIF